MKSYLYTVTLFAALLMSCGGKDDPKPPTAATLIFPENNTECIDGTDINTTQTAITFNWETTNNTDEYRLQVKNLNNSAIQTFSTTTTSQEVILTKGEPYSWFVTSASNNFPDESAISNTWKFYATGNGTENYAPFPAEIIYPKSGITISAANNMVNLQWSGSDIDNDIAGYEVFLDTNNDPNTLLTNTNAQNFQTPDLELGITYFWKVITRDNEGNTSDSGVYQFRLQ
ncbi:hypothetical protein MQE36_04270 [Zhouia spongiae]|uniref:Fibronectin type-III domain-containing protein n=1 Tax=Zhouia spongiae TaxID=2202721 RepID=A0ABY3YPL6_9FLAO|nr:hypothetical protein [Zhouia spongiae]UNY99565.1 hypothetical protein MQE36_04270 [Zhouia spongiae]